MSKIDSNTRIVAGNMSHRRFAYLNKKDHTLFGLLLATDYRNACEYLGTRYHIRQTWLTDEEEHATGFDRDRKWQIVSSIFLNPSSVAFIGTKQCK